MNNPALRIPVTLLGQSGCKLEFPCATCYVDPYLSNSVQLLDAPDLERLIPIPFLPESVTDADWVLITHQHIDHCDPHTLPKLAVSSPEARFLAPQPVIEILRGWGIAPERIQKAEECWGDLSLSLKVRAIPAAHPEITRDSEGNLHQVGYLLEYQGKRLYLAGDTFVRQEILDTLLIEGPIHTAFLPVNEHNFFRGRRGIIGNLSIREAFQFAEEISVQQVVAVHWDMFAANAVDPDEIRFIHQRLKPGFSLLMQTKVLNLSDARISIIIRTLNEATYLDELLHSVAAQKTEGLGYEVVLVDSGSTDGTLEIAERHGCIIRHISRDEFSFGRSLNIGCEAANGDLLVFISGHCVPADEHWLQQLCQPLLDGHAHYTYGSQLGGPLTQFSESRIFGKYYPEDPCQAPNKYFCNNANAALMHSIWSKHRFDEVLSGLEDMDLAKRLVQDGGGIAYVPRARVYHYHHESWRQVRRRFEREAIAMHQIMPQVQITAFDAARYIYQSVMRDWQAALSEQSFGIHFIDILCYRWNQYLGSYTGNHLNRLLSQAEKEQYFFPD
ncbi:glycosyltransferase [Synechococcus sp. Tobar12-5m-g]|uniref:glycosyltransferase n=1 Tax=unclassified Synechococcus TaxID=2626047 RepID=UPI0020CDEE51|nr:MULTISPECIES: glycosyltransferase [unclassified Synechococcus]MCP9773646.1 glycosyltransferase [Synechococcus sp. Tobar12-5m-g]MCP9874619.1 glycosyltransferase [Synechococcus sp. Cruz CV-v-12]